MHCLDIAHHSHHRIATARSLIVHDDESDADECNDRSVFFPARVYNNAGQASSVDQFDVGYDLLGNVDGDCLNEDSGDSDDDPSHQGNIPVAQSTSASRLDAYVHGQLDDDDDDDYFPAAVPSLPIQAGASPRFAPLSPQVVAAAFPPRLPIPPFEGAAIFGGGNALRIIGGHNFNLQVPLPPHGHHAAASSSSVPLSPSPILSTHSSSDSDTQSYTSDDGW